MDGKWFKLYRSKNSIANLLKGYRSPVIQCVITDRFNNPFSFHMPSISYFSASESRLSGPSSLAPIHSFQSWQPLTIFKWIKMFSFVLFRASVILAISFERNPFPLAALTHAHCYTQTCIDHRHTKNTHPTNNRPNRMDVTVNARLFNIA